MQKVSTSGAGSTAEIILTFARYEIKRAIARRKVLVLVAFTVLLDILPYYALSSVGSSRIPAPADPYIWVVGIFGLQPFFLNFTAILIAAGAMSEEYEQGTVELLLSKPVKRQAYFAGKFIGGYLLFLMILALNTILSLGSAYTFFGSQLGLSILPGLFAIQALASLLFYSLAFMLGELIRRSSLAYIFASAAFFASFIISTYIDLIDTLTGTTIYKSIQILLPTSPANSLPILYALPQLPSIIGTVLRFAGSGTAIVPTISLSLAILAAYTISGIVIAALYFQFADISRRVS